MKMIVSTFQALVLFLFVVTFNCFADEKPQAGRHCNVGMETSGTAGERSDAVKRSPAPQKETTPDDSRQLDISGFGDFSQISQRNEDKYGIGQLEIDFEKKLTSSIVFIAAVAYSNESETFELGEFNVDFHFFGSDGNHFRHAYGIDHSGIKVGQFDVPFGLDWQVYPSIDRKTVTGPVAVENTHNEWNDYGIQAFMDNRWFNTAVYALNGFGYDDIAIHLALGGRLGMTPHACIEIGCSHADFLNGENAIDMSMTGIDLQFKYQAVSLKGEYIAHNKNIAGDKAVNNSGFYCEGMYDFKCLYYVARYGMFHEDISGGDSISRISNCLGFVIIEDCEIKYEYQINSDDDNASFMQLVVAF